MFFYAGIVYAVQRNLLMGENIDGLALIRYLMDKILTDGI